MVGAEMADETVRVLHVDDEPSFTEMAAEMLEQADERLRVDTASDAATGLERLEAATFDCVVTDYEMPGTNGIEFLEAIRERDPELPVILYTGEGSEAVASEAISAGVTDYLQKGTGPEQYTILANRITNAVAQARAQQEVDETRTFYGTILQHASDYLMTVDETGAIEYISPAVERVMGYTPDELVGVHAFEFIHPEDIDVAADAFTAVLEEPDEEHTVTYRARHADGSWRWLEVRGRNLLDDPVVEGIIVTARDVTERKAREQRLQERNAKIEALHEVATDIETCDTTDAVYELVVDAAESILEYDIAIADAARDGTLVPQAVSSQLSAEQYYEETPVDAEDNLAAEAYRTGESSVVEDLQSRAAAPADPTFRSALTVPIGEHGVFQSVARTPGAFDSRDRELVELLVAHARARLTQLQRERQLRERTEELQRQNERLDEFASIVSHDLQTPLSVAQGNLSLARDEATSEHHQDVADALDRMEQLIDDLLTLARQGEQVGAVEPVALADVLEACWTRMAPGPATLNVLTDQTIEADPDRLQQLLENLLGNAIDHGGEDVTVTVDRLEGESGFVVADDGPGVPPDERETVFEPGYSTATDGTGFGLAIVREIAEAHGWAVRVTESDAGGAQFEITGVDEVDG